MLTKGQPCATCHGTGKVVVEEKKDGKVIASKVTCPNCHGKRVVGGMRVK